jgi:hypothetical protein
VKETKSRVVRSKKTMSNTGATESTPRTNPLPWPAGLALGVAVALLCFFSDYLGGWGLPSAMAAIGIAVPTLKYQRYWKSRCFWSVISGLALLQIPLLLWARPWMESLRFGFNLLFVMADAFLVVPMVNWFRPNDASGA